MKAKQGSRIGQIFADGRQIDEALRLAARDAIRKHARHNVPVVVWRDGGIAWVRGLDPSPPLPFGRSAAHMEHRKDDDQVGLYSEVDRVRKPAEQSPSDSRLKILIPEWIFRDPIVCDA